LKHKSSNTNIIVGNAHLDHHPQRDVAKFAQAHYLKLELADFCRDKDASLIMAGDFNSLPISPVLSAFYGENIEQNLISSWTI